MVNVRWFLGELFCQSIIHSVPSRGDPGIPFNDTSNFRLDIAVAGQQILGDFLIGLQAGNEPDLYLRHGHRTAVRLIFFSTSFPLAI